MDSVSSTGEDERSPIIVEDETLRRGFTQIPNAILGRADLTPGAKLAYMGLLSYSWQSGSCFPGQQRLADDLGISPRSAWTYLKQLQDSGLVSIQRRGLGQTNIYIIHSFANSANHDSQTSANQEPQELRAKNTKIKEDPKKKTKISNFRNSKAPTPIKSVTNVTPEFKVTHPDLWQVGCSSVTDFIKIVGRGLWTDEAMNVSQWQAHNDAAPKRRTEMGGS